MIQTTVMIHFSIYVVTHVTISALNPKHFTRPLVVILALFFSHLDPYFAAQIANIHSLPKMEQES